MRSHERLERDLQPQICHVAFWRNIVPFLDFSAEPTMLFWAENISNTSLGLLMRGNGHFQLAIAALFRPACQHHLSSAHDHSPKRKSNLLNCWSSTRPPFSEDQYLLLADAICERERLHDCVMVNRW